MNTLLAPLPCKPVHERGLVRRCVPKLLTNWNAAETVPSPPLPVPEYPVPSPPEIPNPPGPVGVPPPMENPIPVREPPVTLPPQS